MNNKNIKDISFKYLINSSYVKIILDILPEEEVSKEKKTIIMELFNYIFNSLNCHELSDVMQTSSMFQDKIALTPKKDALKEAEYLYKTFLEKMLFDSYNRQTYFNVMNECIKVSVGCYQELNNSNFYEFNYNAVGNIRIK